MKFGKRLQSQVEETLPEWRDKYLSYKLLKKRLKLLTSATAPLEKDERESGAENVISVVHVEEEEEEEEERGQDSDGVQDIGSNGGSNCSSACSVVCGPNTEADDTNLTAEEADFINFLNVELEKLNGFYMDKEEEFVIRLQELKERCRILKNNCGEGMLERSQGYLDEEIINIRKDIVNFHGEMVLLENYSSLNYIGLVKILKKHDKLTGAVLRTPYITDVLRQPFFTTELLSKLVHECEMNLQSLLPISALSDRGFVLPIQLEKASIPMDESMNNEKVVKPEDANEFDKMSTNENIDDIYKSTLAALRTMRELRRGSSTYNIFSLPPLDDKIDVPHALDFVALKK